MDFAAVPPEVISGWIHTGPGSASMLAAAVAWDTLAVELGSTAASYAAIISQLVTGSWKGTAAATMSATATRYADWMMVTAEQARQAANQARSAAAAYQMVFAATTPPPVIAANRAQLQSLVMSNVVGQNSPAIAANQAQYAEMWAQNSEAMYGYAANSVAAATLAPFVEPTEHVHSSGQYGPVSGVGPASIPDSTPPILNLLHSLTAGNLLSQFLEQVNTFLKTDPLYSAVSPAIGTVGDVIGASESSSFALISPIFYLTPVIFSWFPPVAGGTSMPFTLSDTTGISAASTLVSAPSPAAALDGSGVALAQDGGRVSAELGRAAAVGGLSTPQTWDSAPNMRLASMVSALASGSDRAGGLHGGIPPIASVVNTARTGTYVRGRGGTRGRLMPSHDGASANGELVGEPVPDTVNPLTDKEREELTGLRAQLAKLVMEQDAMTRLMHRAFQA